jgi:hypothetical protein
MFCGPGQSCTTKVEGTADKMAKPDMCGFAPCENLVGKKPTELMECQCGEAMCIKGMTCIANKNLCLADLPPCIAGNNPQTFRCKCKKQNCFMNEVCNTSGDGTCTSANCDGTNVSDKLGCKCSSNTCLVNQKCVNNACVNADCSSNASTISDKSRCKCGSNECKKGEKCSAVSDGSCSSNNCTQNSILTTDKCKCGSI